MDGPLYLVWGWQRRVEGGKGKNAVSKQGRVWMRREAACTHAKLPLCSLDPSVLLHIHLILPLNF